MELYSFHLNNFVRASRLVRFALLSCDSIHARSFTRRRPQRLLGRRVYVERQDCGITRLERSIRVPEEALASPSRTPRRRDEDHLEINRLLHQASEEVVNIPASEDEDWEPIPRSSCVPLHGHHQAGCPVFVMLPLDTVWVIEKNQKTVSFLKKEKALELALRTFKRSGVEGVMVDIWWGICERSRPKDYDFSAYKRLFRMISNAGLKIQAVLSFHAAGSNVGDTCKIPLPDWLNRIGDQNPDIFYTDKQGFRNRECLSLGCDNERIFHDRTPIEIYKDFTSAFTSTFRNLMGTVITEITVGLGPAGELRYPSYPEGDGRWRFPGVGEFQCYDKYMLADLQSTANEIGRPEWGHGGPHDAGHYNSRSWETQFFNHWGTFQSDYGQFFLTWYSDLLVQHAEKVLEAISQVVYRPGLHKSTASVSEPYPGSWKYEFEPACHLGVKLAGVHWWFNTSSHAAELTAGYYNVRSINGYEKIIKCLKKFNVHLSFTCVEMRDCDHPPEAACSPQGLLEQIIDCCQSQGVRLAGENALQRYDDYALSRIMETAFGKNSRAGALDQITFLRMADSMFDNWGVFQAFLNRMKEPRSL